MCVYVWMELCRFVFLKGLLEGLILLWEKAAVNKETTLTQRDDVRKREKKSRVNKPHPQKTEALDRADAEKDLIFLGLVVMQNKVKPQTAPVIAELHKANIRCVMATGDSIYTACCVAQECMFAPKGSKTLIVTCAQNQRSGQYELQYSLQNDHSGV